MSTLSALTPFAPASTPSLESLEARGHGTAPLQPEALTSERLLAGRREILIRHGQSVYRLRHTSNDKLILTK